jgi:hypothetical protein
MLKHETIKLLRKVKKHILEEPKRFDMGSWGFKKRGRGAPICKTVACIAGWATILQTLPGKKLLQLPKINLNGSLEDESVMLVNRGTGQQALQISYQQAEVLFYVENWPTEFLDEWYAAKNKKELAQATANRIDHFIKTGH